MVSLQLKKYSAKLISWLSERRPGGETKAAPPAVESARPCFKATLDSVTSQIELVDDQFSELWAALHEELKHFELERAPHTFRELLKVSRLRQTLGQFSEYLGRANEPGPTYLVGATTLFDAYEQLCSISTESIIYAAGYKYGSTFTIEHLVPLRLDRSDYGYARADDKSILEVLSKFEESGQLLTCYFHAHPGKGANANQPSSIDLANQARFESGKYSVIGGIFSRDGYLRFFSDERQFKVITAGKGVEDVATNAFRLASRE